jgi:hypothetical protein
MTGSLDILPSCKLLAIEADSREQRVDIVSEVLEVLLEIGSDLLGPIPRLVRLGKHVMAQCGYPVVELIDPSPLADCHLLSSALQHDLHLIQALDDADAIVAPAYVGLCLIALHGSNRIARRFPLNLIISAPDEGKEHERERDRSEPRENSIVHPVPPLTNPIAFWISTTDRTAMANL